MKAYVGVAVTVLYAHDEVTDDCHAGAVARELLVGHLRIVLLRLDELVTTLAATTVAVVTPATVGKRDKRFP